MSHWWDKTFSWSHQSFVVIIPFSNNAGKINHLFRVLEVNKSNFFQMRRKHSLESSYSANKDRQRQGALVSAGYKVSTTIRPDEQMKEERDDLSSVNKADLEDMSRFDSLRKSYR